MSKLLITPEWYSSHQHLVTRKESTRYPGLFVFKYKKKVFYDALWTPELQQCRGLVLDKDWNVVVRPFDKVFNYGENGTTFDRDAEVVYTRKVNGFLGCVTNTEKYGVIYSTTGSLDSDFAKMVEKHTQPFAYKLVEGFTYLFEICDESDPHIIKEDFGAYLIGCVDHLTGKHFSEGNLDRLATMKGFRRFHTNLGRFSDVVKLSKIVKHEGYMVRLAADQSQMLKIKSPYYLTTKFFARKGEEKLKQILDNPTQAKKTLDEEMYPLVDYLSLNKEKVLSLSEQQRITFIEEFFNGN